MNGCPDVCDMHTLPILLCTVALSVTGFGKDLDADQVAKDCAVERDDFNKTVRVFCPKIQGDNVSEYLEFSRLTDAEGQLHWFVMLRTRRDTDDGWAMWATVSDEHRVEFKLRQQDNDMKSGWLIEECSATLSREYLDSVKKTGIKWRVYGKNVTKDWAIPAALVQGFLKRCDTLK